MRQPKRGIFKRRGIKWELDLEEGIDLSIYLFGGFEREVSKAYEKIITPGAIILDIGANIGAHTLPMASLAGAAGQVHAFEPTEYAIGKMRANLSLNPNLKGPLHLHHSLLTNTTTPADIPESLPSSWNLSTKETAAAHPQHGGTFKSLGAISVTTIDAFAAKNLLNRIDLIKLDVDGNEWSILQGGSGTIARLKPPILMEFAIDYDTASFEEMLQYFRDLGYMATDLRGKKPLPLDLNHLRPLIPKNGSINVFLQCKPANGN